MRPRRFTSLLLFQVCPTFIGVEKVSESGLLRSTHRNAGDAKPFLTKVDDKVKAVTREAYELLRAAGAGNKQARDQLDAKLADLKTLLAGTSPKDRQARARRAGIQRQSRPAGGRCPSPLTRRAAPALPPPPPTLPIPEIRDYQKINAELVALLDRGHPLIRLDGAEGQRLLASGLSGPWNAVVEIIGRTGPEVAANLDAPGLTVIARGPTADGAGRGLKAGRVLIPGDAGDAAGYAQSGGILVIAGSTGHRAGLAQSGGILAILGSTGRLACDRQSGGRLFLPNGSIGPHAGRGRRGGRLIEGFGPGGLRLRGCRSLAIGRRACRWPRSTSRSLSTS